MTTFQADWICPIASPPIRNGFLAIDGDKISGVGPLPLGEGGRAAPGEGRNLVTFPNCAIIPGFVNVHAHLELTILRGFLEDLPFDSWIPRLIRAKYQLLTRDEMFASARLGVMEMIAAGVTCVGEVMDLGVSWPAMQEFGLQGVAYQEVFGPAEAQAEEAVHDLATKIDGYRKDETDTFRIGVSPHAPYTVSVKLFRDVNGYAHRENLRLTTHIAESREEGLFVRKGEGLFAERLRERGISVSPAGRSPIAYIDSLGLVRPEMLLIHAIDIDESDIEIIRHRRASIAHCPKSNAKLAQGIAPIAEIRNADVQIGLGTDSVASNNVADMFEEMRAAIFQQRGRTQRVDVLDAHAAFRMATLGGAECLGLEKYLGSLEPGKRADFVVVDLNDPAVQPVYDPIQTMVYSASRHNVRATYAGGREVRADSAELLRECRVIGEKLSRN